ncbi:DUF397 domain-containing protein [Streptomyces sp. A 4/2]|uniref:DUF397 domain-containing protein n=1 Tax=Streptomyces sp. A 4/2 TaxID=2934314 RepID=UPI002025727D|nr:DUF397 domain-containing protein [Streptomyces sp. A 4/2]
MTETPDPSSFDLTSVEWTVSKHSGGGTRKPDPSSFDLTSVEWTVSKYSGGGGNCVRIAVVDGYVLIGDSQNPDRLPGVFTPDEAKAWLLGAKDTDFDFLLDL